MPHASTPITPLNLTRTGRKQLADVADRRGGTRMGEAKRDKEMGLRGKMAYNGGIRRFLDWWIWTDTKR
jgi:hypothetical protein